MARRGRAVNVGDTVNSGQVFLWRRDGRTWYGIDGRRILRVGPSGNVRWHGGPGTDFFRDGDDIDGIIGSVSRDRVVRGAVGQYPGLRVVRQDPFQCLVSFVVSSNSSIQRIQDGLERICKRFGTRTEAWGKEFFLFPEPEALAGASEDAIRGCGVGYRARFVKEAARMVASGRTDLGRLGKLDYYSAKEEILKIPGVGNKVADCVLLFSLDKLEAFPLDRWVIRILGRHYPGRFRLGTGALTDRQYGIIHEEAVGHFGPYAGYAQQFLFKMEREKMQRKWL